MSLNWTADPGLMSLRTLQADRSRTGCICVCLKTHQLLFNLNSWRKANSHTHTHTHTQAHLRVLRHKHAHTTKLTGCISTVPLMPFPHQQWQLQAPFDHRDRTVPLEDWDEATCFDCPPRFTRIPTAAVSPTKAWMHPTPETPNYSILLSTWDEFSK